MTTQTREALEAEIKSELAALVRDAVAEYNRKTAWPTIVKRGLQGVVLSAGYVEPHSLKERVKLSEMETCTRFILTMLDMFAANDF